MIIWTKETYYIKQKFQRPDTSDLKYYPTIKDRADFQFAENFEKLKKILVLWNMHRMSKVQGYGPRNRNVLKNLAPYQTEQKTQSN